jgi:hypothetical protein
MSNEILYQQSLLNKSRKDKFILCFNLPFTLKTVVSLDSLPSDTFIQPNTVQFSVYGSIVPHIIIPATEARYSGQTLNVTSHSRESYPPLEIKFNIDNRFFNYWVIYQWLNLMNNDSTGIYDQDDLAEDINPILQPKYKPATKLSQQAIMNTLYYTDLSIFALDEYNKRTMEFKYTKAFPTELTGVDYDYQDPDEIKCAATFAYSQFLANPIPFVDSL